MAKVAINGLGRIGRATLKQVMDTPELELVGVNDIADINNIAYLIKYDTVCGRWQHSIDVDGSNLVVNGKSVPYHSQRNPADLPWADAEVDIVFECTGFFTKTEDASKHIQAGAKFVIVSGPTKSADMPTVIHGINKGGKVNIISCASCTTNNVGPVMEILNRRIGIQKAMMTTIHAYTATQELVDAPGDKNDYRRGRAGAANFVPTSTGAAVAVTKAMPELESRFDGISVRAPIPVGSLSDITLLASRPTSVEEINTILKEEAATERYQGIFGVTEEELVSSDIIGITYASLADLGLTRVVDGDLVKVMTWYDNEWSFTAQMIREAVALAAEGIASPA